MKAVTVQPKGKNSEGKEVIEAFIISDGAPASLPTTGENIEGMNAGQVFAPFSIIYVIADVPEKVYIADESGAFVAQA